MILYGTPKFPSVDGYDITTYRNKNGRKKNKNKNPKRLDQNSKSQQKTKNNKNEFSTTQKYSDMSNIRTKKKPAKLRNQQKTTAVPILTYQTNNNSNTRSRYDFSIVLEKYDNYTKVPRVFEKYPQFLHIYPAIYQTRDKIQVEQVANKQKDIGRDIYVNRNVKNTKYVKINMTDSVGNTTSPRKPGDGKCFTNWNLHECSTALFNYFA